jgi:dTDP-4-dehydrorhamnose 3,5-epimerase
MRFLESSLKGAFVIEPDLIEDERGFFARTWCKEVFDAEGLNTSLSQISISFNRRRGTLRGLHYQAKPYEEYKLVRCTSGSIYDVIADVRPESPTFKQWTAVDLNANNRKMLYVPPGFAHGFQTLEDETEVLYQISEFYHPEAARGVRWDDPSFQFDWPLSERIMSERDRNFPDFNQ